MKSVSMGLIFRGSADPESVVVQHINYNEFFI
jgi:hypothetical protein